MARYRTLSFGIISALTLVVAACHSTKDMPGVSTVTATSTGTATPATASSASPGQTIELEPGVQLQWAPTPSLLRDDATAGLAGEAVTSHQLRIAEGTFVIALHRGSNLAESLSSNRYRPSARPSQAGRAYYEAETPLARELVWAESPDLLVFVTSVDLGFARLANIADTVAATK